MRSEPRKYGQEFWVVTSLPYSPVGDERPAPVNGTVWYENTLRGKGILIVIVVSIVMSLIGAPFAYGREPIEVIEIMLAVNFFPILLLIWVVLVMMSSPREIGIGQGALYLRFGRRQKRIEWSYIIEILETRKPMNPFEIRCRDGSWIVLRAVQHDILKKIRSKHEQSLRR